MTRQRPFGILAAAAASAPGWLTSAGLTRLVTAAAFAGAVAFMGAPALVAGEIVNHVQIDGDLLDPEGGTLAGTTSDGELDWGVTAGSDTMADTGTDCIIDEEANAFSPTPGICQGQTDSVLIIDLAKGEGATDNIFDKGSKEDCPVAEVDGGPLGCTKGWTFKLGQPPSGKTDLTVVGAWKDQADSPFVDLNLDGMADTYVYLHHLRRTHNGDSHVDYEFNRVIEDNLTGNACIDTDMNGVLDAAECPTPIPFRSEGDFIFAVDLKPVIGGGTIVKELTLRLFGFDSNGVLLLTPLFEVEVTDSTTPSTADLGDGEDLSVFLPDICETDGDDDFNDDCPDAGILFAAVNDTTIDGPIWRIVQGNTIGAVDVDPANFVELAIALDPLGFGPSCPATSTVTVKTRASESIDSALEDTTDPNIFDLTTCGRIIVVKDTLGGDGTFKYDTDIENIDPPFLGDDGATGNDFTLTTVSNTDSITFGQVPPDAYSVTEFDPTNDPGGFGFSLLVCEDDSDSGSNNVVDSSPLTPGSTGSRVATINLDPNEEVTCTYTNTKLGRIIIDKVTVPGGDLQVFNFTLTGGPSTLNQSFGLADATAPHNSGLVLPGNGYVAAETVPTGWDLTNTVCDDNEATGTGITPSTIGNIDVSPGETVTCTFTDTKRGKIIIDKVTVPSGDSQVFNFTLTGGPSTLNQSFGLADATAPHDSGFVIPGNNYVAAETVPSGWDLTNTVCDDNAATGTNITPSTIGNIDVSPGETVTCTFTDTKRGKIIIRKEYKGDPFLDGFGPVTFQFTGGLGAFSLDATHGTLPAANCNPDTSDCMIFDNLSPGTYNVIETDPSLADILNSFVQVTCTDPSGGTVPDDPTRTAAIDLAPGETVICTFENTRARAQGRVTIIKTTIGGGDGAFTYSTTMIPDAFTLNTVSGTASTLDAAPKCVAVGDCPLFLSIDSDTTYFVTEGVVPAGFEFVSGSCADPNQTDGMAPIDATLANQQVQFTVTDGETIVCTFTNAVPLDVCEAGKPASITMLYNGSGSDGDHHSQAGNEVIIIGDADDEIPVEITVFDHKGTQIGQEVVVVLGGTITFTGFNGKVPPRTRFEIRALDGTLLETVQFHTSCSQLLEVGDEFGSLEVVSFTN